MKNLIPYFLISSVFILSCKKDRSEPIIPVKEKDVVYKDSISFTLDGKAYDIGYKNQEGVGNRQFNLKPSSTPIEGLKVARTSGGYYWYGPKDSILCDYLAGFSMRAHDGNIKFSFSKKYKIDQLKKDVFLWVPENITDILKEGKHSFATDFNTEITLDGVAIEAYLKGIDGTLTSYIPGNSILTPTNLTKEVQNNSVFEITKLQKTDTGNYIVEAKFELNLFDKNERLYRLENGFFRMISRLKSPWAI